jgi:hypothetical protein
MVCKKIVGALGASFFISIGYKRDIRDTYIPLLKCKMGGAG